MHLVEMSKLHPGRRLGCFTLQLHSLRPSGTSEKEPETLELDIFSETIRLSCGSLVQVFSLNPCVVFVWCLNFGDDAEVTHRLVTPTGCLWPLVARRRVVPNAFFVEPGLHLHTKSFVHVALDVFQAVLNIICQFLDPVELSGDVAESFRCVGGECFAPHLPFCF